MLTITTSLVAILGLCLIYWFLRNPLKSIFLFLVFIFGAKIVIAVILLIGQFLTYILEFLFK